ncbi:MAG: metal ABC transporter permease [Gammaproteobacteria bacterium]|nr:metal ABC transporter permease [Gammaproteobacteria bacterium]
MNLDQASLSIILPALCAGLLVLATHVPLGMQVLARGIVFIDLAVAQVAALGVILAYSAGWNPQGWQVQLAAFGAALAGAWLLVYTERRWPEVQEALIGVLFVLAASAAILVLANNPHGGEQLRDLLAGQILWVNYAQLLPLGALTLIILALWFGLRARLGRFGFYTLFACAVTASVQLAGVYLVFTSLIIPALAVRRYPEKNRLLAGYILGAAGYAAGLLASAQFDLPSGALIVWSLAVLGVIAYGARAFKNLVQ